MKYRNSVKRGVRCVLAAGTVIATFAGTPALAADQGEPASLGTISVTGTRIKRSNIASAQPVTRISRQEIESSGIKSIGELLTNLPSVGFGEGLASGSFYGTGAQRINLRYLGSDRLLVLLNGKRLVASFGGSVDLNQIPMAIVDHVEILQDGASAIYGSDAIAGVVNIITRKNFNGAVASAYYGVSEGVETGDWDGYTHQYDFSVGTSGDQGHFIFTGSYKTVDAIPQDHRVFADAYYRHPLLASVLGSSATPAGRFIFDPPSGGDPTKPGNPPAAFTGLTLDQCPDQSVELDSGATVYLPHCDLTIKDGLSGNDPANYRPWDPTDADYNPANNNAINLNQNIKSAYAEGSYNINQSVAINFSALYNNRQSIGPRSPGLIFFTRPGLTFSKDINPFGFLLSNSEPIEVAPGVERPTLGAIYRLSEELGRRVRIHKSKTFRFTGGFSGEFSGVGSIWDWDAGYIYSTNEVFDAQKNVPLDAPLSLATRPDCPTIEGCVPINPFAGANRLPLDQANYIGRGITHIYEIDDKDFRAAQANISTPNLFQLPAGGLGLAVGYQHRDISGSATPGELQSIPNRRNYGVAAEVLSGSYSIDAYYGELNIPLLADLPGAKRLGVDIASRYSDYSTFGNTTNSKIGLTYQPIEDLLLRASYSEGFRAANLNELFSPPSIDYPYITDPCSEYPTAATATVKQNCQAQGVPSSYKQPNPQVTGVYGGNPELDPETSVSKSVGFVYSPSQVPGLSFNADYYHIELEQQISDVSPQLILNRCYKQGIQDFCNRIQRGSNGNINKIIVTTGNNGGITTAGIDVGAMYHFPATSFGQFSINLRGTHVNFFKILTPQPDGTTTVSRVVGDLDEYTSDTGPIPEWKALMRVDWAYGPWTANITGHYISDLTGTCNNGFQGTKYSLVALGLCSDPSDVSYLLNKNRRASLVWWDAQVGYATPWNLDLRLGVKNALGKLPTGTEDGYGYISELDYGVLGRYWYMQAQYRF